ncbi:hypothetical protein AVEN_110322-1 [Araneus ventricosus]|uniref:Uncharacterized protein n=1 Tax=Araneus ventricosus TaxID=182803 RepID=A0A4Y2SZ95_ARAVE|nr:hypothetical protein AVEN_110322-1 [Araneus ventricosus]
MWRLIELSFSEKPHVDCDKTSDSSEPGIEPAFTEFEGKLTNHYTGWGYTRWDRWFIKSSPTSILREWFPKRFERKCFRGQPMESEMATFQRPSLLSGTDPSLLTRTIELL